MNYLQLVNRVVVESGVSSPQLTTLQLGLNAEQRRIRDWTDRSWQIIQGLHETWLFHIVRGTYPVVALANTLDPPEYAAGAVLEWDVESFRIAAPGAARGVSDPLPFTPWGLFENGAGLDPAVYAKPDTFSVRPEDMAVVFGPSADAAYELYYTYRRTPQLLIQDADVPICPTAFHEAIVGQALIQYGLSEAAPEILAKGRVIYGHYLLNLEQHQLPTPDFGTLS